MAEHHLIRCQQKVLYRVTVFSKTSYYLFIIVLLKKAIKKKITAFNGCWSSWSFLRNAHSLTQRMKSCIPTTMQISNFPRQILIQWVIFIETSFDGSKLVFDWLVALLRWQPLHVISLQKLYVPKNWAFSDGWNILKRIHKVRKFDGLKQNLAKIFLDYETVY